MVARASLVPKKAKARWLRLSMEPRHWAAFGELVQLVLSYFEGNVKTRPYARALRLATTIGAGRQRSKESYLARLEELRAEEKRLEAEESTLSSRGRLRRLQAELRAVLDLYLEGNQ